MNEQNIPPDPGVGKDANITRFLELAENSSAFVAIVNRNVQFVEKLDLETLLVVLRKCGLVSKRVKSAETARAVLLSWAEYWRQESEDNVTSKESRGSSSRYEDSNEHLQSTNFLRKRTPETAVENTEQRPEPVEKSLPERAFNEGTIGEMMLGVGKVTDKLQATLSAAQSFVQSACQGVNFEKQTALDLLGTLKASAAEISGLQVGLRAAHQAWRLLDLAEARGKGEVTQEMGMSLGQTPSGASYVNAVKKGLEASAERQPKAPQRKSGLLSKREVTRKKIAAQREALRRDELAFRFRACSPNGVVANHLIAEAIACCMGRPKEDYRSLVTDVRIDRFGTYYVQIHESKFEEVRSALKDQTCNDDKITLPGLGDFTLLDPMVSTVKGKAAVVIKGVDVGLTAEQVMREIWPSNRPFWNLPAADTMDVHITGGIRLQMRRRNADGSLGDDLVDSKSVKLWFSRPLIEKLKQEGAFVRLGYRFHTVTSFVPSVKTCFHCGQKGTHVAATCRNKPRCCSCGGPHALKDCPSRDETQSPTSDVTPRNSFRAEDPDLCKAPHKPGRSSTFDQMSIRELEVSPSRRPALSARDADNDIRMEDLPWEEQVDALNGNSSLTRASASRSRIVLKL